MELGITDEAADEFKKSVEDIEPEPYLRVGATKGGCSGWTFSLGTEEEIEPTDSLYESKDIRLIIDTEQHENIIGNLIVDYRADNLVQQGFVFRRTSKGTVCGCGESFTPLNSDKPLGWKS